MKSPIPRSKYQQHASKLLHWLSEMTGRAWMAPLVAGAVLVFFVALISDGFPSSWALVFQTVAAAFTLIMIFVVQHTQSRQQLVTQLKLDELIRATPRADDLLVKIEHAETEELLELEQDRIAEHESLRSEQKS